MAKRITKTFFEQVPIEVVKKIVDPKYAVESRPEFGRENSKGQLLEPQGTQIDGRLLRHWPTKPER